MWWLLNTDHLFWSTVVLFTTGSILSLILAAWPKISNRIGHLLAIAGCLAATGAACSVFILQKPAYIFAGPWLYSGYMFFRIDAIAGFFVLLLGGVGSLVSCYAIGYTQHYTGKSYAMLPGFLNLFLLSIFLVLTASHVGLFLLAWEMMTLISFCLIIYEQSQPPTLRAGFIYFVMSHFGTAFVFVAFFLLMEANQTLSFKLFIDSNLTENMKNAIFASALIGFGTKAGMIPVHVWLPKAHPAAPAHVSALLSGVMIKTAIYGLCRFLLEFLGTGPLWWGMVILGAGTISALFGVLYAAIEQDIKRLLAYCSIENMGIILMGIGAGMIFQTKGFGLLAGLAWAAALYHTMNHAVFKSLLFMGAGAVVASTGIRDMEGMGGLIRRMPATAFFFLVGAASISALPPLNGFVSEWMTLQAMFFLGDALPGIGGRLLSAILFVLLGMTAALAATCFVKAFGITFLGRCRSRKAELAKEASLSMKLGMAGLSLACLILGLWPQGLLSIIRPVLSEAKGLNVETLFRFEAGQLLFRADPSAGSLAIAPLVIFFVLGLFLACAIYFLHGRPIRERASTWACGSVPTGRTQYSATGFSKPVRMAFRWLLKPQHEHIADQAAHPYFGRRLSYYTRVEYVFDERLYRPLQRWILNKASGFKRIQTGSVQLYMGYVLLVTVIALYWSSRG